MHPLVASAKAREGTSLRGKYLLERVLGVGAMAAVYAGVHRNGMRVAVKVLHPEVAQYEELKFRFLREGYIANRIDHPGVVRILDDDEDQDGNAFIAMELLEGHTIESEWEAAGQRLSPSRVVLVTDRLLDVLDAAHAAGVIHRDIKPENVFWTTDGALKVFDFGIARLVESTSRTQAGMAMGTPEFASPEQAGGRVREVDGRSDIFSVGAMMFTLLSGQYTQEARTPMEYMLMASTKPPKSIFDVMPEISGGLANVVDTALSFEQAKRWTSARQMQTALRNAVSLPDAPPPVSVPAASLLKLALDKALSAHAFAPAAEIKANPAPAVGVSSTPTIPLGGFATPQTNEPIPLVKKKE